MDVVLVKQCDQDVDVEQRPHGSDPRSLAKLVDQFVGDDGSPGRNGIEAMYVQYASRPVGGRGMRARLQGLAHHVRDQLPGRRPLPSGKFLRRRKDVVVDVERGAHGVSRGCFNLSLVMRRIKQRSVLKSARDARRSNPNGSPRSLAGAVQGLTTPSYRCVRPGLADVDQMTRKRAGLKRGQVKQAGDDRNARGDAPRVLEDEEDGRECRRNTLCGDGSSRLGG